VEKISNSKLNILIILFVVIVIFPLLLMSVWVFVERWAWPSLIPDTFSTRALSEILGRKQEMIRVLVSSVVISTIVALLSAIIGIMTSRALAFYNFKGKTIIHFMSILPLLMPVTVFAMGIQVTFIKWGISGTAFGVILSHLIYSLPYATRLISEGTEGVGNKLEEQARVLGANGWQAFYKVTFPRLLPVILSAVSMAYIVSFSQYFVTLLIGGGQVKTFAIVMVPYLQGGDRNIACVYSAIFLLITVLVFEVFKRLAAKFANVENTGYYS
jgi:putative spermidine/putrescine transport system permease protein